MAELARWYDDLLRFVELVEVLRLGGDRTPTFDEIGRAMPNPVAGTTLRDTLNRLEARFRGVRLVNRAVKRSGRNTLTPDGEKLYFVARDTFRGLQQLEAWPPAAQGERVEVGIGEGLLACQLLTPALARYRAENPRVQLGVRTMTDMQAGLKALRAGQIDFLACWDFQTGDKTLGGVVSEVVPRPFDIVLVSHDRAVAERVYPIDEDGTPDLSPLANELVLTTDPAEQPLWDAIPYANEAGGGQLMQVDTLGNLFALCRAGIGCGIVPAVYDELDAHRASRQLYFSRPLSTVRVAALARRPGPDALNRSARDLYHRLVESLAETPNESFHKTIEDRKPRQKFPLDPKYYRDMQYAYYLEFERSGRSGAAPPYLWMTQTVQFKPVDLAPGGGTSLLKFTGLIDNHIGDKFEKVEADLFSETLFCIKAKRAAGGAQSSVFNFISVMTLALDSIMVGTWSGQDDAYRPGVYATIYSHKKLTLSEVRRIARAVMFRPVLNAVDGVGFDR